MFLARRLFIAYFTVVVFSYPLYQCWSFVGSSLIMTSFVLHCRPFESPQLNGIHYINEGTILVSTYFLLLLTDLVPDLETRDKIGWDFIYFIVAVGLFNFVLMSAHLVFMLLKFLY